MDLRLASPGRQALLHRKQDLADAEQADHRDQEVEAASSSVKPKVSAAGR
jgi:hypothetical protein